MPLSEVGMHPNPSGAELNVIEVKQPLLPIAKVKIYDYIRSSSGLKFPCT